MEIVTRHQAIDQKLSRYYTGKPCKRGHLSERYTQMSACIECLHPKFENSDIRDRRTARELVESEKKTAREAIHRARAKMVHIKIQLHQDDIDLFHAVLLAASIAHEPSIQLRHLLSRFVPKCTGPKTHIRGFMVFPEDETMLRVLQDSLEAARRPAVSLNAMVQAEERLYKAMSDAAAEAEKGWPAWKP